MCIAKLMVLAFGWDREERMEDGGYSEKVAWVVQNPKLRRVIFSLQNSRFVISLLLNEVLVIPPMFCCFVEVKCRYFGGQVQVLFHKFH